ncbi:CshA/CshB family fibrillar adhesin-related protein [Bifidobacterium sp. ESL0704]|uniref:CshA/CshB family fibrillar adhesin-related protein n=1 Tax=Bifidobacterium sp. ESL0704 TaxID=2983219 RepID=UPI0023F79FC7|nr:CshA/CshB family fibrillar adhesin-related protein [Bifidobacterium sp. ESL0704]WEV53809.1 CshA/CshB family fibrillar adhesin-related protein [Bifidobacterium sp. ESL0704]
MPAIEPQVVATGGQGRFRDAINWVQWSDSEEEVTGPETVWATPIRVGNAHWFSTRCSVTPAGGAGEEYSAANPMTTYHSGDWVGDGFPYLYNQGGTGSANHMVTGLENKLDAAKVSFDFSCSAYLIPSADNPSSRLNGSTDVASFREVPLQGLVFADAESNNWVKWPGYEQEEYIKATPRTSIPGQTPIWRLLDSYRTPGCTTNSVAELKGDTVRFRSDGGQCSNTPPYKASGPSSVMFLQGSQKARVTLKGGGKTSVALGSIALPDFGDAPASYGVAGSLFQPRWTGGELGTDITGTPYDPVDALDPDNTMLHGRQFNLSQAKDDSAANGAKLAGVSEPTPRLGGHEDSESEAHFSSDANWDDTHADQVSGVVDNDEDGLANAPRAVSGNVKITPTGNTFKQTVGCTTSGAAQVKGWIDWNHNGTFDEASEASNQVACTGSTALADGRFSQGSATLTWAVPDDVQRAVKGESGLTQSFERVRITDEQASDGGIMPLKATGTTTSGEVEDYPVDVHVSALMVRVNLPLGRYDRSDQFRMSVRDSAGSKVGEAVTTGNDKGVQSNHVGPESLPYDKDYTVSSSLAKGSASSESRYSNDLSCLSVAQGGAPVSVDSNGKLNLPQDTNVQCTFTKLVRSNPTLQVTTHVNGGHATSADFPVTATSANGVSTPMADGSPSPLAEGSYKVSTDMSREPGYRITSPLSCVTGTPSKAVAVNDAKVTLVNGDNVACEQTVAPRSATLTLRTVVERGDARPDDFDFTVSSGSGPSVGYEEGVPQTPPAGGIVGVVGSHKDGYVDDGDIMYYKNSDTNQACPLTLAQACTALDGGESVTGVRKVTTHRAKLEVLVGRDYRYGGTAEGDGSKVSLAPQGGPEHAVMPGRDEYVKPGAYSVAESLNAGYKLTGIAATMNGVPITVNPDGGFAASPDADVVVTLNNIDEPGMLEWSNTDSFTGSLLRDSEWKLTGPEGEVIDVPDCADEVCTGADQDSIPGKFHVDGLEWGDWTITEVRALKGYGLVGPQSLVLDPSDPSNADSGPLELASFASGGPVSPGLALGSGVGQIAFNQPVQKHGGSAPKVVSRRSLSSTGADVAVVTVIAFVAMACGLALAAGARRKLRHRG